ncbi:MAG TPA: hydrolase [Candidatus Nanopelagicales bacterium]|nr:hydrolase [Candidatus Nanopelagicales bacterium]
MNNINELTIDNSTLVLIDHQPFVAFPVRSISPDELTNNVTGLAKVANALKVPTILTTILAEGGPLADPLFIQLQRLFPEVKPIDRRNTNAWSDPAFVAEVKRIGRKKLIMAGLWTEVCLAQTVISAIKDGYEVYFVTDASGGVSVEAHQNATQRMIQAGARPMNWMAVMAELCPDNTSPEYQRLYDLVVEHGGGVSYAVQYVLAQLQRKG